MRAPIWMDAVVVEEGQQHLALMHLDAVVNRAWAKAKLVGEAEAESGMLGVHRQDNGEDRVEPQGRALDECYRAALVSDLGGQGQDGAEQLVGTVAKQAPSPPL